MGILGMNAKPANIALVLEVCHLHSANISLQTDVLLLLPMLLCCFCWLTAAICVALLPLLRLIRWCEWYLRIGFDQVIALQAFKSGLKEQGKL